MLGVTALLYSMTRRLFNERVGLCAAIVFSVTEPALFLGHLATYDAPALFLLALAGRIAVRPRIRGRSYLPALPMALPRRPGTGRGCSCRTSCCCVAACAVPWRRR